MSAILAAFSSRRIFFVLLLGFSSGIPLALTGSTLQAWMASEGVDLAVIGVFSLVGLPYAVKYLWAPVMDRFVPPFLGRRRGWMLVTQAALALAVGAMAFSEPKAAPGTSWWTRGGRKSSRRRNWGRGRECTSSGTGWRCSHPGRSP